jgi:hypothetical protein
MEKGACEWKRPHMNEEDCGLKTFNGLKRQHHAQTCSCSTARWCPRSTARILGMNKVLPSENMLLSLSEKTATGLVHLRPCCYADDLDLSKNCFTKILQANICLFLFLLFVNL